jgi:hypothetical protein
MAFKLFNVTTFVYGVPEPILADPPVVPLFNQLETDVPVAIIVVRSEASNQNEQPSIVKGKGVVPPPPLDTTYVILILP